MKPPKHIALKRLSHKTVLTLSREIEYRDSLGYHYLKLCDLRQEMFFRFMCLKESIERAYYRPDLAHHVKSNQKEFNILLKVQNGILAKLSSLNRQRRKLRTRIKATQLILSF